MDDELTHATFTLAPGAPRPALRRTDLLYRPDPAGAEMVALLYGTGEADARAALARAGLRSPARLRPGTGEDLLLAAGHALPASPTVDRRGAAPLPGPPAGVPAAAR
ncbi:hypothetical protein FRACA_4370003 [Frankia canadensis]|uniref:Uncharacterized protein n=1 Tax=Frankia canadensis TaxID=1836972 RepID=A0A2I2KXA8_9ACTN|nr:hypothetical protein FRACA_4370003 [Frankia canadensis]SOU57588.1 hypothetical protein FRACA_4370003 [Frankia canadensis]